MGGWLTVVGDVPDFRERLARFNRTFSVSGVPDLRVETYALNHQAKTIAWAWHPVHVPDIYVKMTEEGFVLVLCGVVTDLGRFGPVLIEQEMTATRLLEIWIEYGDDLIRELNGSFSCLFYDPRKRDAITFTDRFASRSVWFTQEDDLWIAGNFPSAIAAIKKNKPNLDPVGLWSLFHTGRHVGQHGLFKNINCLLAGEKAVLSSDGRQIVRKWREIRYSPDMKTKPHEWGEKIAKALQESSVRYRKVCKRPHIFLSGGLDSRIAAAAFGNPLKAVSVCTMPNAETRLASIVSKVLGIDHKIITRSLYWYLDTLDAAALISGGNFLTHHTHFIVPASEIVSRYSDSEFLLGDLLENFNKHYFLMPNKDKLNYDPQNMGKVLHSLISYSLKGSRRLGIFFREEIRHKVREEYSHALKAYARTLVNVSNDDADRLDTFLRWADVSITPTYNMITCLWPIGGERNIAFDNEVNDIRLKIPSKLKESGVLHKWTLYHLNKMLPLIPNANTFLSPLFPDIINSFAKKVRPILGRIRRSFDSRGAKTPVLQTSGSWLLRNEMYRKDRQYREKIEEVINDRRIFSNEIFEIARIRETWEEYLAGNTNLHIEIDVLLSFGILERLLGFDGIDP